MGETTTGRRHASPGEGNVGGFTDKAGRLCIRGRVTIAGKRYVTRYATVSQALTGRKRDIAVANAERQVRAWLNEIIAGVRAEQDQRDAAAWAAQLAPPPTELDSRGREFVRLHSPTFRRWLYARDNGTCGICGKPVAFEAFHADHIRPVNEGGNNHVSNLRVSHVECNLRRGQERRQPVYVG